VSDSRPSILVLGAGGNVSQGIMKALALSSLRPRIVAACVEPSSAGLFAADAAYVSPLAYDPGFANWLVEVCLAEGIDGVLSGVEPVLEVLASEAEQLRRATGAIAVVSPSEKLAIGADKLETCRWLTANGLPCPGFADAGDRAAVDELLEQHGYPLVAKPRRGKGSAGVRVVRRKEDLASLSAGGEMVIQQYLGSSESEFTAGCFCDRHGALRGSIVMRRVLAHGTTQRAEIGAFSDVREVAERICRELRPVGPCNVQLREQAGEPIPFELNVRFSGTTPVRAHFGFNEVDAAVRHFVLGEPGVDLPAVHEGVAVRYWNEIYPQPAAITALRDTGTAPGPAAGATTERWGPGP
jgi:carbamoyl-phosphate synthase large subunit